MLKIETNVPAPTLNKRENYPFQGMKVGDSFLLKTADARIVKNARSAAWIFGRRHPGVRFSCRKAPGGWRIWRVE